MALARASRTAVLSKPLQFASLRVIGFPPNLIVSTKPSCLSFTIETDFVDTDPREATPSN